VTETYCLKSYFWISFYTSYTCHRLFLNKNQTTVEWRPHWYRLQGHKICYKATNTEGSIYRSCSFWFHLYNNNPTTSNLVQDLGDNVIEAEGDRSIAFHASFTVYDSCTTGILAVLYYLLHCTWKNLLIGIVVCKLLLLLYCCSGTLTSWSLKLL